MADGARAEHIGGGTLFEDISGGVVLGYTGVATTDQVLPSQVDTYRYLGCIQVYEGAALRVV